MYEIISVQSIYFINVNNTVKWIPNTEYQLFRETLYPGDIFFTATDGIGELTDTQGKQAGDFFIKRNLIRYRKQTADQILDTLYESVKQIAPDNRSISDDITCLLLKV